MKVLSSLAVFLLFAAAAVAQQPQIPTLQVCNGTNADGGGTIKLIARSDALHSGTFEIKLDVGCDTTGTGYPSGAVDMTFDLSDSNVTDLKVTSIEQLTTTGKHTPTLFLNGRCTANSGAIPCHIWLMVTDNVAGTPDVVSVLVVDKTGKRITYGTGPLAAGNIAVASTGF